MVGGRSKIRFEYRLPRRRCCGTPGRLQSHKNRVDLLENLGILELHCPAMLSLVIVVEDSKSVRPLCIQLIAVASPGSIDKFAVRGVLRRQVECVKNERLP